jgi:hypothetical protein
VNTAPAVTLFLDRARASAPSFALDAGNAQAIGELVRRLDGLPLAIELVAARVRLLSPRALVERLGSALDVAGPFDLPDRQRSLRHAIEWSCALLSPDERRAFGQLSVFSGGWTLEAAEAVLDPVPDVLGVLEALVDRALVRPLPDIGRFSMLATIHAYAGELLEADSERAAVLDRHAGWVVTFVESIRPSFLSADQGRYLRELEAEIGNVREAFARLKATGSTELGLRLGTALLPFGQVRAQYRGEFRRSLESFIALLRIGVGPVFVANALGAAGQYALWDDDAAGAQRFATESRDLFEALGDRAGVADQLASIGYAVMDKDPTTARAWLLEALETYRSIGGHGAEGFVLGGLSIATWRSGDVAGARRWIEEAQSAAAVNLPPGHYFEGFSLIGTGRVEQLEGDLAGARRSFVQALDLFRALNASAGVSLAIGSLADLAIDAGRPDLGATLGSLAAFVAESSQWFGGRISGVRNPVERSRPKLQADAFDEAVRRGRSMTVDEAIAEISAAVG